MSSSPAAAKVVVEYAKSGRSLCKICSKSIASGAPRLGMVSKDPRGFDMTKWHHLNCFPSSGSSSISPAESIAGFSSLKSSDRDFLKKLENEVIQASNKVCVTDEEEELGQGNLKKQKFGYEDEGKLEMSISTSDIKDGYKDAILWPKWKAFQTIIFLERDVGLHDSRKIAAFDFDGCLAKTSVKRVGADAWSVMYPSIPEKLQNLYNDGYKLVIFTNESNIERWKNKRQVFIACGLSYGVPEDPFRKPEPGMWKIMEKEFNSGLPVDTNQSFYVGDAAGRPDDHSDADIKFAQAIGLKFYVPEEYFINLD
ncbi:polynucleotide 3'-phosphatase ZDP-like isoform X3 [Primulina huaijiensis]|uniref:polynucleotide 3'-phosphatase ZDP-like isoform X3 n=1 Tax=Primulina huaijiensis TaxID=1492673 RepID=UPI003CC70309